MSPDVPAGAALSAAFFDHVRDIPFGGRLSQPQVDGMNILASTWARDGDGNAQKLAYILATAFHETAETMQPIAEYGRGAGHPYGVVDQTGKAPYGRGFVQLTWRQNYEKADAELGLGGRLAADYDLALEPDIAAKIAIMGMMQGWFTGKKLSDYIRPGSVDYVNARRIINGTDLAHTIAIYATNFDQALGA